MTLSTLLHPGSNLLNRLSFSGKFALFGAVATAVVAFLVSQGVPPLLHAMHDTRGKIAGLNYLKPLRLAFESAQQHRGLNNAALGGDASARERLPALAEKTASALNQAQAMAASPGYAQFGLGKGISDLRQAWDALAREAQQLPAPQAFARHNALLDQLLRHLREAADATALVLHDDLAMFYAMDIAVNHAPDFIESAARLRGRSAGLLAARSIQPQDASELAAMHATALRHLNLIIIRIEKIGSRTPVASRRIEGLGKQTVTDLATAWDTIRGDVAAGQFKLAAGDLWKITTAPVTGGYSVWDGAVASIEEMLTRRMEQQRNTLALKTIAAIAAILLMAYLLAATNWSLRSAVGQLRAAADRLAAGDLTARAEVGSRDELAQVAAGYNRATESFAVIVRALREESDAVHASARQLGAITQRVLAGSRTQTEAAAASAACVEQVTSSVDLVAQSAAEATKLASRSAHEAREGNSAATQIAANIEGISHSVHETAERINALSQRSQQIGQVSDVIRDIAEQTNLLALNAAIEAARAGEQGRGFAVVADEVRKLAERTTEATSSIGTTLAAIRTDVSSSVDRIAADSAAISDSHGMAQALCTAMAQLGDAAQRTETTVRSIADAAREQSVAGTEIAQQVVRVASGVEENEAALVEAATAVAALDALALRLQASAARFVA